MPSPALRTVTVTLPLKVPSVVQDMAGVIAVTTRSGICSTAAGALAQVGVVQS